MSDFNPFLDLSAKNDEDLLNDLSRIYSMISHYSQMGNDTLLTQLHSHRDTYLNEMTYRSDKKRADKDKEANNDPVVIDTERVYEVGKHRQIL